MDAPCKIQGSIHVFRLIIDNVSRILGTYHRLQGYFDCFFECRLYFLYSSSTCLRSFGSSVMMASTPFSISIRISSASLMVQY